MECEENGKQYISRTMSTNWLIPSRYQLSQLIGVGSYGSVCEAYDLNEKKLVAIKRIHNVFQDLVDSKRILREIAILNRLKHRTIVQIYDIFIPNRLYFFDELYIVLEIADSDLKKLLKSPVYLSELHVILLIYNLVVGVKYMHSAGIYHRDLKPANCLVNQDCSVKICDFGLARSINGSSNEKDFAGLTISTAQKRQLTGHVVSRWYRAPELILLQSSYTEAIDVWSIGCIFAELLTMIKENVSNYTMRTPIFPGKSCFPLSPDNKSKSYNMFRSQENKDQLNVMFNILGTPSEEDMAFLETKNAKKYLSMFEKRSGIDLAAKFPGSSKLAIDLLKKMLVFNPHNRITIDEILEHPVCTPIRQRQFEQTASKQIEFPFDDWKSMTENELRLAFIEEVRHFHPCLHYVKPN